MISFRRYILLNTNFNINRLFLFAIAGRSTKSANLKSMKYMQLMYSFLLVKERQVLNLINEIALLYYSFVLTFDHFKLT